LAANGVDQADIRTSRYSLAAEYEWTDQGRRDLGYRALNSVHARIRDLSSVGAVIDAAVAAAGDAATVNSLDFSVSDRSAALTRARAAAWEDVRARADHLAELSGVTLGRPIEIVEEEGRPMPPTPKMLRMEAASATPVEPGTLEVTTTIRARVGIVCHPTEAGTGHHAFPQHLRLRPRRDRGPRRRRPAAQRLPRHQAHGERDGRPRLSQQLPADPELFRRRRPPDGG